MMLSLPRLWQGQWAAETHDAVHAGGAADSEDAIFWRDVTNKPADADDAGLAWVPAGVCCGTCRR